MASDLVYSGCLLLHLVLELDRKLAGVAIYTIKLLKLWTPKTLGVITLNFEQGSSRVMHPKDADRMANSVICVYTVCPDLSVRKHWTIITIMDITDGSPDGKRDLASTVKTLWQNWHRVNEHKCLIVGSCPLKQPDASHLYNHVAFLFKNCIEEVIRNYHEMCRLVTKPTKWQCPEKTQISLGICLVWSESSLCA